MRNIKIIFIAVIFVFIGVIGVLTVFNNREISDLEARPLQTFVEPDVSSVMDGSFSKNTDTAFSDQLEFRDFFVQSYYKISFQKYNGDVTKGTENQLFASGQDIPDYNKKDKQLKGVAAEINKIADELAKDGRKFIFVSIPRKDAVMTEFLPDSYVSSDELYNHNMKTLEENFNENVIVVDGYDLFVKSGEKGEHCYFSTDHHINFTGGMLIYNEIGEIIKKDYPGFEITGKDAYNVEKVVVNGSFNRLIGQSVKAQPEELLLSLKKQDFTFERKDEGELSDKKIWGTGTTYASAYMDDDNPETIVTTSNTDGPRVLITGSSFSNILETLFVPDVSLLTSVDYRHNKSGKSLEIYAKETDAEYVIYVPSQSGDAHSTKSMKTHLGLYAEKQD